MTRVIAIPNGQFAENCYLIAADGSNEAVIVDPGEEAPRFLARAKREALDIRAIWLTHAHIDHVLGVHAIHAATGAPISMHPADQLLYQNLPEQARWFGLDAAAPPAIDHDLVHGQRLEVAGVRVEVRHAPGHSPGSVCFVGDGFVIAGDVLFQGSIGRTDLPGGNLDQLMQSIREQLLVLPDETVVYSGHGPITTIGAERASNPFLTGHIA